MNRFTRYFLFPFSLAITIVNLVAMGFAAFEYRAWQESKAIIEGDLRTARELSARVGALEHKAEAAQADINADALVFYYRTQHLRATILQLVNQMPGVEHLPRPLAGPTWPPWPMAPSYRWDPDKFIQATLAHDKEGP